METEGEIGVDAPVNTGTMGKGRGNDLLGWSKGGAHNQ